MESDTFSGNFVVKLTWRLSGKLNNLIYHVFFHENSNTLQPNLSWNLHKCITLHTVSIKSLYYTSN